MNKWPLSLNPTITWERKERLKQSNYFLALIYYYLKKITWFGHPVLGVMTFILFYLHPLISLMMFSGYMIYEVVEFVIKKDTADDDIRDFLVGFFAAAVFKFIVEFVTVYRGRPIRFY